MPLGAAANLTSDAHLAALSIEHGARLYSTDNDLQSLSIVAMDKSSHFSDNRVFSLLVRNVSTIWDD
jgi:hypothetical protein